jgi:signal peptidase
MVPLGCSAAFTHEAVVRASGNQPPKGFAMGGVIRHVGSVVAVVLALSALGAALAVHVGRLSLQPALSGSMRPVFQPGDLVVTQPEPVSSLRQNQVIEFVPPGQTQPYMHRVIRLTRTGGATYIVTKGDANRVADPWGRIWLRAKTIYKLTAVIPKLGWVVTIPRGTLMLVLLVPAGLILLLTSMTSLLKQRNQQPTNTEVHHA